MYTYFRASFKCMWLMEDVVYYYRYSNISGMELFSDGEWLGSQIPCTNNMSGALTSLQIILSGASIGAVDIRQLTEEESIKLSVSLELES